MPIRPENRSRYPANWKAEIRPAILARADNHCEGSPAYPDCRAENGQPHPVTGSRVVLTIAHLNHLIEDCSNENLKALCQRCHNTHDAAMRQAARRERRQALPKVTTEDARDDIDWFADHPARWFRARRVADGFWLIRRRSNTMLRTFTRQVLSVADRDKDIAPLWFAAACPDALFANSNRKGRRAAGGRR
jgi:hypothetical protein